MSCGLHVRIILVFDAVFDAIVVGDAGWKVLRAAFDQLAADLMRDLPPPSQGDVGRTPSADNRRITQTVHKLKGQLALAPARC